MRQLPDKQFNAFLAQWRKTICIEKDSEDFMENFFKDDKKDYYFSDKQLESIAGLIKGYNLSDVILLLGNTPIDDKNSTALTLMSAHLSEIQVSYTPKGEEYRFIKESLPGVSLKTIMSLDETTPIFIEDTEFVLNSSHHYTKTPKIILDRNTIIAALTKAHEKIQELSDNNIELARTIEEHLNQTTTKVSPAFLQQKYLEITGMSLAELMKLSFHPPKSSYQNEIPFEITMTTSKMLADHMKVDAKEYKHWAKVFEVLVTLLANTAEEQFAETYKNRFSQLIDEKILLFTDFVALSKNEDYEKHKAGQQSLNSKEVEILNSLAITLTRDAASQDVQSAKYLVNATGIIASTSSESMPIISSSVFLSRKKLILFLNELAPKIHIDGEQILPILKEIKTLLLNTMPDKIETDNAKGEPLSEYSTLCKRFSQMYKSALRIISGMRSLGLATTFIDNDDCDIPPSPLSALEAFLVADQSLEANSAATLLIECLRLSLEPKKPSLLHTDLDLWLSKEMLPKFKNLSPAYKVTHSNAGPSPLISKDALLSCALLSCGLFAQRPASPPSVQPQDTARNRSGGI